MNNELKSEISFVLDGKELKKNVSAIRVVSYNDKGNIVKEEEIGRYTWTHVYDESGTHIKSIKTDAETGKIVEETSPSDTVRVYSDGTKEEQYHSEDGLVYWHKYYKNDVLIYEVYIERYENKSIKYTRRFEDGKTIEEWCPVSENAKKSKNAEIKISENGKTITGKRTFSEEEHKLYEEFSDGSKGWAKYTDDNKKLLHRVDRTGCEQINKLDENGNLKSYKYIEQNGYDALYIISDSLSYHIHMVEENGVKKEEIRVTEFSKDGKKTREIAYKVI